MLDTLLQDFNLSHTSKNKQLIRDNLALLENHQEIYRLATHYPELKRFGSNEMHGIDPTPLDITLERPSITLTTLDPTLTEYEARYPSDYRLIAKSNNGFKDFDSFRRDFDKILVTEKKMRKNFYIVDDDLWFTNFNISTPLSWGLRNYPDSLKVFKNLFFQAVLK